MQYVIPYVCMQVACMFTGGERAAPDATLQFHLLKKSSLKFPLSRVAFAATMIRLVAKKTQRRYMQSTVVIGTFSCLQ